MTNPTMMESPIAAARADVADGRKRAARLMNVAAARETSDQIRAITGEKAWNGDRHAAMALLVYYADNA